MLDIPEDEYMEIYKLDRLKGMAFRVTIAPLSSDEGGVHDGE